MAADKDEQVLRDKLFHKVMGVLPPKKAIRYIQIENKLHAINRYQIAERIPLVR
jgi:glucan phosphoethanolaminetransferase (alkaline phosphatase superfamily)